MQLVWSCLQAAMLVCLLGVSVEAAAQPLPMPWAVGPAVASGADRSPVSFVEVPVALDLTPLFEAADDLLPAQAGHWPKWRDWHGIDTRYRAWRGPLKLAMQGDVLQALAHVRYQVQARKELIAGLTPSLGCGVDEPPRQALIGVVVRLAWTPDWQFVPHFRVLPTRFLDRCQVTVANIDVSPLVGGAFEDRLESSLEGAIAGLRPRLDRLRLDVARAWAGLQMPYQVLPGLWLHIKPLALALAPPRGEGSRAHSALLLAFDAKLSHRARPMTAPTPLPPLVPFRPTRSGLHLGLALDIDYGKVSAALGEQLDGQPLDLDGRRASVESVWLAPRDGALVVTAELGGELAGRLEIVARPSFDVETQSVELKDLSFVFDADDMDLEVLARIFYDRIRDRIAEAASEALGERIAGVREALTTGLAGVLPPSLNPDISGLHIDDLEIRVGPGALTLVGSAGGVVELGGSRP